jgi:nucleoid-associated protein YgaU
MRSYAKSPHSRPVWCLLALVTVELGALQTLSRSGSLAFLRTPGADPSAWRLWLASTPPQDAVAAVLRLVATGCAWWLASTTALYLAARLARVPGLVRALAWTTPRAVRHLIDRALALSVVASLAGSTAAFAGGAPPAPVPVVAVVGGPPGVLLPAGTSLGTQPVPSPEPLPIPTVVLPRPAPPPPPPPDRHTVLRGDNLWTIAAGHLADTGVTRSNGQIAPYWRELVQDNRASLRSGNPDLIFPGEAVALPPTP